MQAYKIALAVLVFNVVVATLAMPGTSPFGAAFPDLVYVDNGSAVNFTYSYMPNGSYVAVYDSNFTNQSTAMQDMEIGGFDDLGILNAVMVMITAFANATVLLPLFIMSFGIPTVWAVMLTTPIWMVYGWGIVQTALRWGGESGE